MIPQLATEVRQILHPVSLNSAAGTTAAIDTKGWRHLRIVVNLGAVGGAATVFRLQESNDDGSADAYVDITGMVAAGTTGDTRLPQTTDANKPVIFDLSLLGRDRYIDFQITSGATTVVSATAILSRGEQAPDTATEKGATGGYFQIPA
jgi:hypothetical protein